jgi:erythronate-4-phosphate dehydrogenase
MKIVVDENMPFGREAFETLGEVVTAPGRGIDSALLRDAELLLVRSVTKVNAALLEGTAVRFVGTATIGEDHLDKGYLKDRGIPYASAPGCNANSVSEYITGALFHLAEKHDFDLTDKTLGIVGVGNVGSRVLAKAEALGMRVVLNDPPRAKETGDPVFQPLEAILDCDIVTVHVPLENEGPHPTYHLVDEDFFSRLRPGAILLNTARGPVVENADLKAALDAGQVLDAVLDVWEGEPQYDPELLEMVAIGTPHIAGYSFDGKVNGTRQVYEAACAFLSTAATWDASAALPEADHPHLTAEGTGHGAAARLVKTVYDIMHDDAALRGTLPFQDSERGAAFDRLRKHYPRRREFQNTRVTLSTDDAATRALVAGLGFRCD